MRGVLVSRLKRIERAIDAAAPGPRIFEIVNDPERERAGPDEATIDGAVYQRLEGEDRGVYHARLMAAAVAASERVVLVSLAQDYGLENYRRELAPGETFEIGAPGAKNAVIRVVSSQ
jgi:hypothetical protein